VRRRNAETHLKEKEEKEEEEKKGSERALTRISRKTRKDANEFLKIQNLFEQSVFYCFLC